VLEDRTLPSFSAPILSATGTGPYGIAVADLNGDGHEDLVTVNSSTNSVSVLYGNGDGTFKAPLNYTVGTDPKRADTGSLRNNGLLDIVVANRGVQYNPGSVSILLNNGDGTFSAGSSLTTDWNPSAIALADLNNDGNLDIIVTTTDFYQGHHTDIFLGNGDGTFQPRQTISDATWGFVGGPVDLAVGDFNGDGKLDIVTANSGYTDTFLQGNGDGTFKQGVSFQTDHRNFGLTAADLRGNGILDVISAGDTYGYVSIMRGNGNGTFQQAQRIGFSGSASVVAADFRGTGKPDLAIVDETGDGYGDSVRLLLNDGNGNFSESNTQSYPIAGGPGAQAHFLAVGDFNGDGAPDVAVAMTAFNQVSVLLTRPDVTTLAVSAAGTTGAGDVYSVTVTAQSAGGSTNPYYTGRVHFTSTDTTATVPSDYTFTQADAGVHTFNVTLRKAGSQSVTVRDTANSALTGTVTALVTPATATKLVVSGYPSPVAAGTVNTFRVAAADAYGNTVTDYDGTVTLSSTDPQGIVPHDYTFSDSDHGSHVFAGVLRTAGSQTLTATSTTSDGLTGSQAITVVPAAAKRFVVEGYPSPTEAGSVNTFSVTVLDAYNNVVTGYGGTVTLTSTDPQAILPQNYTFTAADNGTRIFGAVLFTAGTQSITATQLGGSVTGSQTGIEVTAAGPSYFVLTALHQVNADQEFTVTLTAYDAYGNVATGYLGTVQFSSSDAGADMPASYTFTAADAGVHVFTLQLYQTGEDSITVRDLLTTDLGGTANVWVL
jgi:hypothetical protein